jgi:hypothetical protein
VPKTLIHHFITMGDSLSDRGTMDERKLFGLIPMSGLSGLSSESPKGRFTNGYVWLDAFTAEVSEQQIIDELEKKKGMSAEDISDAVISHRAKVESPLRRFDVEGSDLGVEYKAQDLVRSYNEGGLTAHDYSHRLIFNPKLFFSEKILATLDEKRERLLADDSEMGISAEHKATSLIIEWSGANDLITVNPTPSIDEAIAAVDARTRNVEALYQNGYRHFILFNMPDLSLTPRYQRKSEDDQRTAKAACAAFNAQLTLEVQRLKDEHPGISIDVFDVNKTFTDAFNNPRKYDLDPAKKHSPYSESKDFRLQANGTSPASGYMFWDDVHPSADVHQILAQKFYKTFSEKYHFTASHESLIQTFREHYVQKLNHDKAGFFGFFRRSNILQRLNKDLSLENILEHALYKKGHRTKDVLLELGWIDAKGRLISDHPSLVLAMRKVREEHETAAGVVRNPLSIKF